MTAALPPLIPHFAEIAPDYDVLLCDVWGVIHNGVKSFPAACAALQRWRERQGPVVLISNAARPSHAVAAQLDGLAVPRGAYSALVTSGDVTRALLAARAPGPVFAIGPERGHSLYEGLGLTFAGLDEAAFICCTGPDDDDREGPEDYRALLTRAAERALPMICANPDKVVQRGERLVYCGGALAELYETLGGRVEMAGKPYAPIYDVSLEQAAGIAGAPANLRRVLAIGDGIATDLAGAAQQGIDCLFIAGGIHGVELRGAGGRFDLGASERLLAAKGARATYAMEALV
ncbi:MAG: TIGR01459 family HAD-type hydrolase [Caulobacteraceae bacterium]